MMAIDGLGGRIDGPIEVFRGRLGAPNIDHEWPKPHPSLVEVIAETPEVSRCIAA